MDDDLSRFKRVQGGGVHDGALDELREGAKRSHWIWFVFPQLEGLGGSDLARRFALEGVDEAQDYLDDELLRARLAEACGVVQEQVVDPGARLLTLMGSQTDALKLVSSLTLFAHAAGEGRHPGDASLAGIAESVLDAAAAQGYPRCAFTLRALE